MICVKSAGTSVTSNELGENEGAWVALEESKSKQKEILFNVFV